MGGRKNAPHDPTAERTADQSTQTAGGLHQTVDRVTGGADRNGPREGEHEDVLNRNEEDLYDTPRRYDEAQ